MLAIGPPLGFDESFRESQRLQDSFIASLELPTYHDFQSYQFLDVLDALSFRMMVIDYIIKFEQEGQLPLRDGMIDELAVKELLEKEINKLIYQKQSDNIKVFRYLWEKDLKKKKY